MNRKPVTLYTDGSCLKNGQPSAVGGWAAILAYKNAVRTISGGCSEKATNNRMELLAVISGLKQLKANVPCEVTIVTDSKYVCHCVENLEKFHDNGWTTEKGNTPCNTDLLMQLLGAKKAGNHELRFQLIKSHSGHKENDRCDSLAREEAMKLQVIG